MNKPQAIGTRAETAVVRYLQANGWPNAERRRLRGRLDAGDITGTPGVCIEVKGGDQARYASDNDIADWLAETWVERGNADADVGVLVVQRRGVGPTNAGRWWAVMRLGDAMALRDPSTPPELRCAWPVRMLLADVVELLRGAGYGDPVEVSH